MSKKDLKLHFVDVFFQDDLLPNNVLPKHIKVKNQVAFLLGIGYADDEPRHKSYVTEPTYDEVVNWK